MRKKAYDSVPLESTIDATQATSGHGHDTGTEHDDLLNGEARRPSHHHHKKKLRGTYIMMQGDQLTDSNSDFMHKRSVRHAAENNIAGLEVNRRGYPKISRHNRNQWIRVIKSDTFVSTVPILGALAVILFPLHFEGGVTSLVVYQAFAHGTNLTDLDENYRSYLTNETTGSALLARNATLTGEFDALANLTLAMLDARSRPNFWLFNFGTCPVFFAISCLYVYEYLGHSCSQFTWRWRLMATMVGVAQLLTTNYYIFEYTLGFAGYSRAQVALMIIGSVLAAATTPFLTPLFLLKCKVHKNHAIDAALLRSRLRSNLIQRVKFDLDGDGLEETVGYDTTHDGLINALDTTGDGLINAADLTGDGRIDAVDTNGDGRLNAHDTTGDGILDKTVSFRSAPTVLLHNPMDKYFAVIKAVAKWKQASSQAKNRVNITAWFWICSAMVMNVLTWMLLNVSVYIFVHKATTPGLKGVFIVCFNLMLMVLKTITKAMLTNADAYRLGTMDAEWHRYILANRCEFGFALYGAVFKFTLFTEIKDINDFISFAGVDLAMDTVKNMLIMSEIFLKIDVVCRGSLKCICALVAGDDDSFGTDGKFHVDKSDEKKENEKDDDGPKVHDESDAPVALMKPITRHRARICYNLHTKVMATSCGALQLVFLGCAVRLLWNDEYYPHLSRLDEVAWWTTLGFATLRWVLGITWYLLFSGITNRFYGVSPLAVSLLVQTQYPDMLQTYCVSALHVCTDVYFALLIAEFGYGQHLYADDNIVLAQYAH